MKIKNALKFLGFSLISLFFSNQIMASNSQESSQENQKIEVSLEEKELFARRRGGRGGKGGGKGGGQGGHGGHW